jgi:hypothetical protein
MFKQMFANFLQISLIMKVLRQIAGDMAQLAENHVLTLPPLPPILPIFSTHPAEIEAFSEISPPIIFRIGKMRNWGQSS